MDNELCVSQQCALAARKAKNMLSYLSKTAASRTWEVTIFFYCTLVR